MSAPARSQRLDDDAAEWGPLLRGERRAGRLLSRMAAASAATMLLGAAVAAPLALAHLWRPAVALPVLLVVLAVSVRCSRYALARPMPPWSLVLCLLIALGAGVWAAATHDEHVVLRRDAGSYALYGQQLASAHALPIRVHVKTLGGAAVVDDPDVLVASPGFYRQGTGASTTVVPQFLIGVPAWLSVGMWLGGWTGLLIVPAIFGALSIVGVGALAVATIGPRWAPLVCLATALTAPVLHADRSTYSEPAALLALSVALTLLASATEIGGRSVAASAGGAAPSGHGTVGGHRMMARRIGFFAGLVLGGAGLVRLDALREVVLMIPVAVLLATRRHPSARPLVIGAVASTALCALIDVTLDRPYLRLLAGSLVPVIGLGIVLSAAGAAVLVMVRRRERSATAAGDRAARRRKASPIHWPIHWPTLRRCLPWALAGLVVVIGVALATRPWWLVGHTSSSDPSRASVARMQVDQGLLGDGTQTYVEHSVTWVSWWVGPAALLLALGGATAAAYRCGVMIGRGKQLKAWIGPFVIGAGSIVLVLVRPGITPDHPWADRRLVVSVLPGVILLATAAVAALVRLARRSAPLPVLALAVLLGSVAITGPAEAATAPVAGLCTELGELGAVHTVCRSFQPGDVAVLVGERAANEWPQVIRGICHVPVLVVRVPHTATTTDTGRAALATALARVLPEVEAGPAGHHVVLISDRQDLLVALGTTPHQLVDLTTREDPRLLTRRPEGSVPLVITLWGAPVPG